MNNLTNIKDQINIKSIIELLTILIRFPLESCCFWRFWEERLFSGTWYQLFLVFNPPKDIMESNQNGTQEPAKTQTKTTNLNVEFSETLLDNATANIHHDNLTTEFHSNHNKEQDRRNDLKIYKGILKVMKSFQFLNCFFLNFLSLRLNYMIKINFKNNGITKIGDDQYIPWVGNIATLVNGVSRPLWGYIYDKIGF